MRRILFVDDEPDVLEGLRDSLRPQRRVWRMSFAEGGEAALEALERERFDVVVSDMRMPGIDGATLLSRVQDEHPDTVRIVLSGYAEVDVAVRAAAVAHMFLAKPCAVDALRSVVERACTLQSLLREEEVRRATAGAATLPSQPLVYGALRRALDDPDTSAADVARIVEQDMAMSAKVLQLVNSAFFGLGRRISSVGEAVSYLGLNTLETLVVSAAAFQAFSPGRCIEGFEIERVQRHGALVAQIGRRLTSDPALANDVYTAGMLHDIGMLILAAQEPEELEEALRLARASGRTLHAAERERRGLTHAEVGAYLLGLWGLPHPVVEAVAHQHDPRRIDDLRLDSVALVNIANQLAHDAGSASCDGLPTEVIDETLLDELGVLDRLDEWRRMAAGEAEALEGA